MVAEGLRLAACAALLAAGCAGTPAPEGDAEALNRLGDLRQSEGRYRDAVASYEKAVALGHAPAMNNLGRLYEIGLGVAIDRPRALDLYERAVDMGSADAMWSLANFHGVGRLEGRPNLMQACVWTVRARRFAEPKNEALAARFGRVLPQLDRLLSVDQMAECKRQAEAWAPAPRK